MRNLVITTPWHHGNMPLFAISLLPPRATKKLWKIVNMSNEHFWPSFKRTYDSWQYDMNKEIIMIMCRECKNEAATTCWEISELKKKSSIIPALRLGKIISIWMFLMAGSRSTDTELMTWWLMLAHSMVIVTSSHHRVFYNNCVRAVTTIAEESYCSMCNVYVIQRCEALGTRG